MALLGHIRLLAGDGDALVLGRLYLDLAQLGYDLLRARPPSSLHLRLLRSWLTLIISPVQSEPVRSLGSRNGFAVTRETASRKTYIATVVASGQVRPAPGDMPKAACFIGKPFTEDMVQDRLQDILPDGRKPPPLRQWERGAQEATAQGAGEILTTHLRNRRRFRLEP